MFDKGTTHADVVREMVAIQRGTIQELRTLLRLIAEHHRHALPPGPLTVKQAAERLGTSAKWVYEHAEELGASRRGNGPKARLRFDPAELDAYVESRRKGPCPPVPSPVGRRREQEPSVELLPIGRRRAVRSRPSTKRPGSVGAPRARHQEGKS